MFCTGEFKKFDYGKEKNNEKYGQDEPPFYDLFNVKDFNILMVCGKTDLLASPVDYHRLKKELTSNGNTLEFREYEEGHLGVLMPEDKSVTENTF